jgi:hypothetical protein
MKEPQKVMYVVEQWYKVREVFDSLEKAKKKVANDIHHPQYKDFRIIKLSEEKEIAI